MCYWVDHTFKDNHPVHTNVHYWIDLAFKGSHFISLMFEAPFEVGFIYVTIFLHCLLLSQMWLYILWRRWNLPDWPTVPLESLFYSTLYCIQGWIYLCQHISPLLIVQSNVVIYTVKTELREVFEKCFNFKQKCFVATEISHVVFHNSDTKCLDHPNSYLQLFGQ